ncbi:MAG: hypothetical protein QW594_02805 [Candidatus Woesearchaeota archaeon]
MDHEKEIIKQLKEEHNKTASWIEFFSKRSDVLEKKLDRLEHEIQEIKDKQLLLAQTLVQLHEERSKQPGATQKPKGKPKGKQKPKRSEQKKHKRP